MTSPEENELGGGNAPEPVALLTPFTSGMNTLGAVLVLVLMLIVNIDVFGRWIFNSPLAGTLELTEMGVVAVVYLTVAHAVAGKRLTRSDALLDLLERRGIFRVGLILRTMFNLLGALVFALIAYGQAPRMVDAWTRGYFTGNVGIFTAPTWPLEAILFIGAIAASLQFLVLAYRRWRDIRNLRGGPV